MQNSLSGIAGGVICLLAIFTPSFLVVVGALPFWEQLRRNDRMQAALAGINSAVVGLLLAALYTPVWTSAIYTPQDFALGLMAFVALQFWRLPPWLIVIGTGFSGWLITHLM
jgi:chromate transporter